MEIHPPAALTGQYFTTEAAKELYRAWREERLQRREAEGVRLPIRLTDYCKTTRFKRGFQKWRIAVLTKFLLDLQQEYGEIRGDGMIEGVKRTIARAEKKLEVMDEHRGLSRS